MGKTLSKLILNSEGDRFVPPGTISDKDAAAVVKNKLKQVEETEWVYGIDTRTVEGRVKDHFAKKSMLHILEVIKQSGMWNYGVTYAIDKVEPDVRERLVSIFLANAEGRDGSFARVSSLLTRPSVKLLGLSYDSMELYQEAMCRKDFFGAEYVALNLGLGEELTDYASHLYVEQQIGNIERGERGAFHAVHLYYMLEGDSGLDNAVGRRVARQYFADIQDRTCIGDLGRLLHLAAEARMSPAELAGTSIDYSMVPIDTRRINWPEKSGTYPVVQLYANVGAFLQLGESELEPHPVTMKNALERLGLQERLQQVGNVSVLLTQGNRYEVVGLGRAHVDVENRRIGFVDSKKYVLAFNGMIDSSAKCFGIDKWHLDKIAPSWEMTYKPIVEHVDKVAC